MGMIDNGNRFIDRRLVDNRLADNSVIDNREYFLSNALPFWDRLTEEHRDMIANRIRYYKCTKNQNLDDLLKENPGMMIVCRGRIRVYISSTERDITLYRIKECEVFGMSIPGTQYDVFEALNVEADRDSEIFIIPAEVCVAISSKNCEWQMFAQAKMAQRLSSTIDLIFDYAFTDLRKRLANTLLHYYDSESSAAAEVTHEMLAKDLGTAREVISRTLKQFEKQGFIQLSRGSIAIIDADGLQDL